MIGRKRAVVGWLIAALVAVAVPGALAGPQLTFRDKFTAISYAGSDGNADWSGSWRELPFPDGVTVGPLQVVDDTRCSGGNCLRIGAEGVFLGFGTGVAREADLSGTTAATLTFRYRRALIGAAGGTFTVSVSRDGVAWDPILNVPLDGSDSAQTVKTYDISDWITDTTHIGFGATGSWVESYVFVDDIKITASGNEAPTFDQDLGDRSDAEGDTVSFASPATDPDDDAITYSADSLPPGVTIDPDTGTISGTLAYSAAAGSPFAVTVRADDGFGGTDTDSFSWTVANVNRPPSLLPVGDATVDELSEWVVDIGVDDPDMPFGDELTWSLSGSPTGMAIDQSGTVVWTPSEVQGPGVYPVVITVVDASGAADSAEFTVTVAEVNSAPVIAPVGDQVNAAGESVSIDIDYRDDDRPANGVVLTASGLPPGVSLASGRIAGTVGFGAAAESPYVVTVTATDNGTPPKNDQITFAWTIVDTNRSPSLSPIPAQTPDPDGVVRFTAVATDPDGDELRYSLAPAADAVPAGASIDPDSGVFSWDPTDAQRGATYGIRVVVKDDGSPPLSAKRKVTIEVPMPNRAPELSNPGPQLSAEGDLIELQLAAGDPDGDKLEFSASGLPEGLVMSRTGLISGELGFDAAGGSPHEVSVSVRDDGVPRLSDTVEFTWEVANTNRPPEPQDTTLIVLSGETVRFTLAATDPDDDPLTYTLAGDPQFGELTRRGLNLTYVAGTAAATEILVFVVSDGIDEVPLTVTIEVRAGNDPPVAGDDEYKVAAGATLEVDSPGVLLNDEDPDRDPLTVSLESGPDHGTVVLDEDGSFTYTADAGFSGDDSFRYAVSDGSAVAIATVRVTVVPVVVPPPRNESTVDIIQSLAPADPSPPAAQPASERRLSRSLVIMARAGIRHLSVLGLPLGLLLLLALVGAVAGRVTSLPLFSSRRRRGIVGYFDPVAGMGYITDEDDGEVFLHESVVSGGRQLRAGSLVAYRAIEAQPRPLATSVWLVR